MATDLRRSRKKSLISSKRGLFGNKTQRERSVSPMFSGLQVRGDPAYIVNKEAPDEEVPKELSIGADPAYSSSTNEQVEVHDGPTRVGKTDSSAGALEAPAKTNIVNG